MLTQERRWRADENEAVLLDDVPKREYVLARASLFPHPFRAHANKDAVAKMKAMVPAHHVAKHVGPPECLVLGGGISGGGPTKQTLASSTSSLMEAWFQKYV